MLGGIATVIAGLYFLQIKRGIAYQSRPEEIDALLSKKQLRREIIINTLTFLANVAIALTCYGYWIFQIFKVH